MSFWRPTWLGKFLQRWSTSILQQSTSSNASSAPSNTNYVIPQASGTSSKTVKKRLTDVETLTKYVLYVTVATMVGVLVTLAGVVSDQWKFNQQAYKEDSDKAVQRIDSLNTEISGLKSQVEVLKNDLQQNVSRVKDK